MKVKILPLGITIIILLTSINVNAVNTDENNYIKNAVKYDTISFSQAIIESNEEYVSINIQEANTILKEPGKPELPVYVKTFKFPLGTKIIDIKCMPSEIKRDVISGKIKPAPRPVPLISLKQSKDSIVKDVQKNNDVYSSSELYPDKWYDYSIGCGLDENERVLFLKIRFYLVRYSPKEDSIYYMDNVDVKVTYEEGINPLPTKGKYDLVIITPRRFYLGVLPLAIHKNRMGVSTKIKTTESIYRQYREGRDKPEKIKYFIENAIEKWDIKYVLLVGGRQGFGARWFMPARYSHTFDRSYWNETSFASDLYFADIYRYNESAQKVEFEDWDSNENGIFAEWTWKWDPERWWWYETDEKDILDLHPDVYVGRLACKTRKEVRAVVRKIILYERFSYNKPWFKRMIVAGGDTVPYGDGTWEGEYENELAASYMEPLGFEIDRYFASDESLTNYSLIPAIRKGAGFLFCAGHGSPVVWSTHWPENDTGWIDALVNFDMKVLLNRIKLPICVVGGCHNSQFDVASIRLLQGILKLGSAYFSWVEDEECFGKMMWLQRCWSWNLVRQKWGGAIATIGNTGLGWGIGGEGSTETGDGFISTHFFQVYNQTANLNACSLGLVHSQTLNDYIIKFDPNEDEIDRKTVEQWALLGDPSLKIGGYP